MADVKCEGSSFGKAIMVKAPTDHAGVDAQHDYIAKHFGKWRSIGVKYRPPQTENGMLCRIARDH